MPNLIKNALRWPLRFAMNGLFALTENFCPLCRSRSGTIDFRVTKDPAELPAKFCTHCNHMWPTVRV
jgi:hypothetical protein